MCSVLWVQLEPGVFIIIALLCVGGTSSLAPRIVGRMGSPPILSLTLPEADLCCFLRKGQIAGCGRQGPEVGQAASLRVGFSLSARWLLRAAGSSLEKWLLGLDLASNAGSRLAPVGKQVARSEQIGEK